MSKWIIVATMPSGGRYAFSVKDETFALVPIEGEHGAVRNALAWDSKQDAEEHLKRQLEAAPQLSKLGEIQVEEAKEPH